jgi:hypothetical protein
MAVGITRSLLARASVIAATTCALVVPVNAAHAQTAVPAEDEAQDARDLATLRQALADSHRKNDVRKAAFWSLMGIGYAGMATVAGLGIYELSTSQHPQWVPDVVFDTLDGSAGVMALAAFFTPGRFEGIEATLASTSPSEPAWSARRRTEGAWLQVAEAEHHNRRLFGWFYTGLGVLLTGGSTAGLIALSQSSDNPGGPGPFVAAIPEGALMTIAGVYLLTSDGPVESALHEYERSAGRTVGPQETAASALPFVAAAQRGALLGLRGSF